MISSILEAFFERIWAFANCRRFFVRLSIPVLGVYLFLPLFVVFYVLFGEEYRVVLLWSLEFLLG